MFNTGGYDFTAMLKKVTYCKDFSMRYIIDNPSGCFRLSNGNSQACLVDFVKVSDKEFSFSYNRLIENGKVLQQYNVYEEVIRVNVGVVYKPLALIRVVNGCIELLIISENYHDVFCFVLNFERQSVSRKEKHYSDRDLAKLCFKYSFELDDSNISYITIMKNSIFHLSFK